MELLQCVNTNGPYKRAYHSEDREMSLNSRWEFFQNVSLRNLTHQRETSCNIESWLVQTVILKSNIEVTSSRIFPLAFYSAKSTPRQVRSATLSGGERRVSLPNGHYSASTMGRASSDAPRFRHYGSSLSLAEGHGTHELTSRTLRHYCYFDLWSYFFSEMGNAIIYLFQCNDK